MRTAELEKDEKNETEAKISLKAFFLNSGQCDYAHRYRRLRHGIDVRYPGKCKVIAKPVKDGNPDGEFEVFVNEELIHSKIKGHGFVDCLEKSMKIFDKIADILGLELPSKTEILMKNKLQEDEKQLEISQA